MDRSKLIKLIEKKPTLYNSELSGYHSTQLKTLYWRRICRTLRCQPKDVFSVWKYLKCYYIRQITRKTRETSFSKKWRYEDGLSFLFPIIEKKIKSSYEDFWNKYGNDESDNLLNDDECDNNETITTDNKLFYGTLLNTNDATEYITSLTDTIAQWPEDEQIKFTDKISMSLDEIDSEINCMNILLRNSKTNDHSTQMKNSANNDDDDVIFVEKQDEVINIESDDDNADDKEENNIVENDNDKITEILIQDYTEAEIVSEILPDDDSDITIEANECSIEFLPETSEIEIQENSVKDELLSESNREEILPD